jgi:hypothetical protein
MSDYGPFGLLDNDEILDYTPKDKHNTPTDKENEYAYRLEDAAIQLRHNKYSIQTLEKLSKIIDQLEEVI